MDEQLDMNPMMLTYPAVMDEPHPDFVLPAIDDRRAIRLSDFRGTKVLLIHFASW